MIDIVFPRDDPKEFIRVAELLGLEGLLLVYTKPTDISSYQKTTSLKLLPGIFCQPDEVRRHTGKYITIVEAPQDQSKIRSVIEQSRPDILIDLEFSGRSDFIHHRASGLNHIMCDLAKQKNVAIGFDFSSLLVSRSERRAVFMGRMMQNIRFARKFGFTAVMASFAREPHQMRSPNDLQSLFITLGASAGQAKDSLGWR